MAYRSYRKRRGRSTIRRQAKFRRTSTKQLGFTPGTSNTKRNAVNDGNTAISYNARTLHSSALVSIEKVNSSSDQIDRRQRDLIKVSGIKICMQFENVLATADAVQMINVAIITARDGLLSPGSPDFFRSSDTSRATAFSTTLSSTELDCLPINSDKYIIHKRWRRKLLPALDQTAGRQYGKLSYYLKIGKQFRFDGSLSAPTTPVPYLVWWWDKPNTNGGTGVQSGLSMTHRTVVYFKETSCC